MPEEATWSIRDARQLIFGAWALYGVVWAVFLLPLVWAPAGRVLAGGGLGAGILWVGAFIFALAIAFLGLSVGVVAGWVALRERPNRTWLTVTLVAVSILGLFAQAFLHQDSSLWRLAAKCIETSLARAAAWSQPVSWSRHVFATFFGHLRTASLEKIRRDLNTQEKQAASTTTSF